MHKNVGLTPYDMQDSDNDTLRVTKQRRARGHRKMEASRRRIAKWRGEDTSGTDDTYGLSGQVSCVTLGPRLDGRSGKCAPSSTRRVHQASCMKGTRSGPGPASGVAFAVGTVYSSEKPYMHMSAQRHKARRATRYRKLVRGMYLCLSEGRSSVKNIMDRERAGFTGEGVSGAMAGMGGMRKMTKEEIRERPARDAHDVASFLKDRAMRVRSKDYNWWHSIVG